MSKPKKIRGYQIALRVGLTWKVFASYAEALGTPFSSAQNSLPEKEALVLEERVRAHLRVLDEEAKIGKGEGSGTFEVFHVEPSKGLHAQYDELAEEAILRSTPKRKQQKSPRRHVLRQQSAVLSDVS